MNCFQRKKDALAKPKALKTNRYVIKLQSLKLTKNSQPSFSTLLLYSKANSLVAT